MGTMQVVKNLELTTLQDNNHHKCLTTKILLTPNCRIFFGPFRAMTPLNVQPTVTPASNTEKTLARIRAGLSLGLFDAERFQALIDSNSGDVEELQRIALSLVKDIELIDERAKTLDPHDPGLIVPREIVTALASQATTGDAVIAEWLDSRKAAAVHAIQLGVSQGESLGKMARSIERLSEE